jgi:hypothetical protein
MPWIVVRSLSVNGAVAAACMGMEISFRNQLGVYVVMRTVMAHVKTGERTWSAARRSYGPSRRKQNVAEEARTVGTYRPQQRAGK